jgi:hypothetical protein
LELVDHQITPTELLAVLEQHQQLLVQDSQLLHLQAVAAVALKALTVLLVVLAVQAERTVQRVPQETQEVIARLKVLQAVTQTVAQEQVVVVVQQQLAH